jgi:hypothetical protein
MAQARLLVDSPTVELTLHDGAPWDDTLLRRLFGLTEHAVVGAGDVVVIVVVVVVVVLVVVVDMQ